MGSLDDVLTPELCDELMERIIEGESVRAILSDPHMPNRATLYRRLDRDPELAQRYSRALAWRMDILRDEIFDISDNVEIGQETVTKPDGSIETREGDMLGHRKLKIDTRKWAMARLAPERYGDRVSTEISGPAGGPVQIEAAALTEVEAGRRIAFTLARAERALTQLEADND